MGKFVDPLVVNSFLDANILNDVAGGKDSDINEMLGLADSGQLSLMLPYSVRDEIDDPRTPSKVKSAAAKFIFSEKVDLTQSEQRLYADLLCAGQGEAEAKNIASDLRHVCEAAKYGGYFITKDRRLLARAKVAADIAYVEIVSPHEFLNRVKLAQARAVQFAVRQT